MPVRQAKRKKYKEGRATGQRMTLTGRSKLPCSFKVQFAPVVHLRLTQCCPISTHNSSQPELK